MYWCFITTTLIWSTFKYNSSAYNSYIVTVIDVCWHRAGMLFFLMPIHLADYVVGRGKECMNVSKFF